MHILQNMRWNIFSHILLQFLPLPFSDFACCTSSRSLHTFLPSIFFLGHPNLLLMKLRQIGLLSCKDHKTRHISHINASLFSKISSGNFLDPRLFPYLFCFPLLLMGWLRLNKRAPSNLLSPNTGYAYIYQQNRYDCLQ